jgi:hypothetical protein
MLNSKKETVNPLSSGSKSVESVAIGHVVQWKQKDNSIAPVAIGQAWHKPPGRRVTYKTLLWSFYVITTALFVLDRFTTNVFPRQAFKMGKYSDTDANGFKTGECLTPKSTLRNDKLSGCYSTSSDKIDGFLQAKNGPTGWGVTAFDVLARVSGRWTIAATNGCFFSMFDTFHVWLHQTAPAWIDMHDEHEDRRNFHISCGWQILLATLPHIWSFLLPVMFHSFPIEFDAGTLDWPGTIRTSFKTVDPDKKVVTLSADDVWRLIHVTILLGFVIPYTYKHLFKSNWPLGMKIHMIAGIAYLWDIIRRHSHPHSWIFNGPVFLLWIIDKYTGAYLSYNKDVRVECVKLSANYMVAVTSAEWSAQVPRFSINGLFWLRETTPEGRASRSHPFTCMTNPLKLQLERPGPTAASAGPAWKTGFIIRISQRSGSFTRNLSLAIPETSSSPNPCLDMRGAQPSCYNRAIENLMLGLPVAVMASGSGAALAIDFVAWAVHNEFVFRRACIVMYTTRDRGLFEFVLRTVQDILALSDHRNTDKLQIYLSVTAKDKGDGMLNPGTSNRDSRLHVEQGRLDFEAKLLDMPVRTSAFFCGAPLLQRILRDYCREDGISFTAGHVFDQPAHEEIEEMALKWFDEGHHPEVVASEVGHGCTRSTGCLWVPERRMPRNRSLRRRSFRTYERPRCGGAVLQTP